MTTIFDNDDTTSDAQTLTGLIGALLDGHFTSFTYNGIEVNSPDGTEFYISDPNDGRVHGRMKAVGDPITGIVDWVQAKADIYGNNA